MAKMPVVWCDGFDATDSSHDAVWYTTSDYNAGSPGRFGVGQYADIGVACMKSIANGPYVYMGSGRAVRYTSISGTPTLFEFGNGLQHVRMIRDGNGFLQIRDANGTTIQTYSAAPMQANIWYHVALYAKWNGTTGQMRGFYNGNLVLSADNIDTDNNISASPEFAYCLAGGGHIDDWYIQAADSITGTLTDQFLGDLIVREHFPQSDGDFNQWTKSSGGSTNSYQMIDEIGPDDDTTYLLDSTPGNRWCGGFGTLAPDIASIVAVQQMATARFDTTGPHSIRNFVRQVGVANHDAAAQAVTVTYAGYHDVRETDPVTGIQWTKNGFESRQYGIKDES